jgi:hypothetical protein
VSSDTEAEEEEGVKIKTIIRRKIEQGIGGNNGVFAESAPLHSHESVAAAAGARTTVPEYVRLGMNQLDTETTKMVQRHGRFEETCFDIQICREWKDWCWFEQNEASLVSLACGNADTSPSEFGCVAPIVALVRSDPRLHPSSIERSIAVLEDSSVDVAVNAVCIGSWSAFVVGVLNVNAKFASRVTLRGCAELTRIEMAVRRVSIESDKLCTIVPEVYSMWMEYEAASMPAAALHGQWCGVVVRVRARRDGRVALIASDVLPWNVRSQTLTQMDANKLGALMAAARSRTFSSSGPAHSSFYDDDVRAEPSARKGSTTAPTSCDREATSASSSSSSSFSSSPPSATSSSNTSIRATGTSSCAVAS